MGRTRLLIGSLGIVALLGLTPMITAAHTSTVGASVAPSAENLRGTERMRSNGSYQFPLLLMLSHFLEWRNERFTRRAEIWHTLAHPTWPNTYMFPFFGKLYNLATVRAEVTGMVSSFLSGLREGFMSIGILKTILLIIRCLIEPYYHPWLYEH